MQKVLERDVYRIASRMEDECIAAVLMHINDYNEANLRKILQEIFGTPGSKEILESKNLTNLGEKCILLLC